MFFALIMKYNNILKKLWRNKNCLNLKIIKKIRLLKDKSNKKFMSFKTPTRLDKAKKYGYLKKPNYGIVKIKLKKRKDKKKVKKGKIFGKTSNHGVYKIKRYSNYKTISYAKLKSFIKKAHIFNGYWLNESSDYIYYEFVIRMSS